MYKKITMFLFVFMFTTINLNAEQVLYDENSNVVDMGSDICANKEYTLLDDVNTSSRSIFVLDENNYIKEVINTNKKETKVKFPPNIKGVKLLLVNKVDNKYDFSNSYYSNYNIKDCSLQSITKNYSEEKLLYDLSYENRTFTYKAKEDNSYKLEYQIPSSKRMKNVKFDEVLNVSDEVNLIQLHEYYQKDSKEINNYYEINIIDDETFIIRKVKSLDIKEIKFKNYINYKFLFLFIVAFLLFLIFYKLERVNRAKRKNFKNKLVKKYKR